MKYDLGIIGGLGPLASSYLYEMITKRTNAKKDQDHLNIVLLSHPSIPDRTKYILKESNTSPLPFLIEDAKLLEKLGVKMISIPCNTSCYFHENLQKEINIPINNLVKNTVKYIKEKNIKKVAILATQGTIKSNLYQKELEKENISYITPNREKVMELIYDYIKAGKEVTNELFNECIKNAEVDAFILGCTELSLLKPKLNLTDKFIDPLEIEVDNILNFFNKKGK
ncbi:MAG: aspartate/glutamate racemase family protein [Bacilli bacterium]|nr:aspartate/glutamate racemase family protein [Bacilli bacterium]